MARTNRTSNRQSSTENKIDAVSAIIGHYVFVKVKKSNEYSREGIEIGGSKPYGKDEDPMDVIESMIAEYDEKAAEYMEQFLGDDSREPNEEPDPADDGGAGDLEEDEILAMKKPELLQLIEDEDLDVDPSEYKQIAKLREAVCDAYFDGGDNGGDNGDSGGGDNGGGDDLTEDEIMEMKKPELLQLIEDEGLDVDPSDYKQIAKLREAVCDAYFDGGDGGCGYTEDEIMEMDREGLIQLIEDENLDIDHKARKFKKTSVLAEEVCSIVLSDDFGDFNNTDE